jgi:hypothetical protein
MGTEWRTVQPHSVEVSSGNRYHGRIQTLLDEFTLVEAQIGSRRLGFVLPRIYKDE